MITADYLRPQERIAVRRAACAAKYLPVEIVPGDAAPALVGEASYHTTMAGVRIRHPNAYKWPKTYHKSTQRVIVGAEYVLQLVGPVEMLCRVLLQDRGR